MSGDVHTVAGDTGAAQVVHDAEFVEVTVTATGRRQMVPAEWMDHEVLARGFERVDEDPADDAPAAVEPVAVSEVQLVAGDEREGSLTPAVRDAGATPAPAPEPQADESDAEEPPTEKSLAADIDAYAADHHIDLGDARTKAEKIAAIEAAATTTDPDDTPSPEETPAAGDEEN